MKQVQRFFSQLISNDELKSSARFSSLVALFVSSFVLIYFTFTNVEVVPDLFLYYISVFATQYAIGKGIGVFNKPKENENV